jgi:hypothetical protein
VADHVAQVEVQRVVVFSEQREAVRRHAGGQVGAPTVEELHLRVAEGGL